MGILPLQYEQGDTAVSLGLTGEEVLDISGLEGGPEGAKLPRRLTVTVTAGGGPETSKSFEVLLRIDTPKEEEYFRHGGILLYVLRQLRGD
jgi:aconitate hydratase